MNSYKDYNYFKDKDGLWKVKIGSNSLFIVALDDSKLNGIKKINYSKNNEQNCENYIDWMLKNKRFVI